MHSRTLEPEIQYATLEQQGETAQLGMWVFIMTETLFIGALVFTYFVYRISYPHEFAEAAKDAIFWAGSINLGLLLTSSLTMVLAINAVAQGGCARGNGCCSPPPRSGSRFSASRAPSITWITPRAMSCPACISR